MLECSNWRHFCWPRCGESFVSAEMFSELPLGGEECFNSHLPSWEGWVIDGGLGHLEFKKRR